MEKDGENMESVKGGEGYECGEGKIEGVRERGTGAQTSTTRRCADVFRCPRAKPRKTDTGGRLCGLLCALKGANLETSRKCRSQFIRDEQGGLLRDPEEILQRWTRHFQALLNNSSPMLDPLVVHSLPQLQTCHDLGEPPTRGEVALVLRRMANAKALGSDISQLNC